MLGWGVVHCYLAAAAVKKGRMGKSAGLVQSEKEMDREKEKVDAFTITPLPDFRWQDTAPLKFRNFKPKYHLTMSTFTPPPPHTNDYAP